MAGINAEAEQEQLIAETEQRIADLKQIESERRSMAIKQKEQ